MLTTRFKRALSRALPRSRLTGIITWRVEPYNAQDYNEFMFALGREKKAVLDLINSFPEARVNRLDGMPQAILDAPADCWRKILCQHSNLVDDKDLVIEANLEVFQLPPVEESGC